MLPNTPTLHHKQEAKYRLYRCITVFRTRPQQIRSITEMQSRRTHKMRWLFSHYTQQANANWATQTHASIVPAAVTPVKTTMAWRSDRTVAFNSIVVPAKNNPLPI